MIVRSGMFIKSLMNIRAKAPKALAFGAYFLAIHFSLFTFHSSLDLPLGLWK